jgi:cytochrome b561
VLHWITAALVLTMLPLGVVIANKLGGPWQDRGRDGWTSMRRGARR